MINFFERGINITQRGNMCCRMQVPYVKKNTYSEEYDSLAGIAKKKSQPLAK